MTWNGWLALLALAVLAGCAGAPTADPAPGPGQEDEPTTHATGAGCVFFCEPSVAVGATGRIVVLGDTLRASEDRGVTWEDIPLPPLPDDAPPGAFQNDALVQYAPDGSLYFSSLVTVCSPGACSALLLYGLQVSRSDDGGRTWTQTASVFAPDMEAVGSDRQWLVFGDPGVVCLHYQRYGPAIVFGVPVVQRIVAPRDSNVAVTCSTDGGKSFPATTTVLPAGHQGSLINGRGVLRDGTLYIPFYTDVLRVAVSRDLGATFSVVEVGDTGDYFPILASDDAGLVLAWKSAGGVLRLARSPDGETWSAPEDLPAASQEVVDSPWIETRADGVVALAYVKAGETNDLVLWEGDATRTLATGLTGNGGRPVATDFAHFALGPDGAVHAVYGDLAAEETQVVRVAPSLR